MSFPDTSRVAVEIRGAGKSYPTGIRALEPIDLCLREGEFVTVVGPSGCGKSTLLRLVAGLTGASEGSVEVSAGFRTPRLAYVFQSPTLMPWANVQANVRLPLQLAGVARAEADRAAHHALELVGLPEFARSFPRELSGGMQMRVSIARALATEPRLLLMDEPFGALDEITRNRLDREISGLSAHEHLTVLFVTHSIYEAVFLSSRVLVMSPRPGRIHGEIGIDAPRPRGDAFRSTAEFTARSAQLADMLGAAMQDAAA